MATILCVDDEVDILQVLRRTLDSAGHRIFAVTDVDAAFDVLRSESVDLIISDYLMPETTGVEFLHALAEAGITVPLIMLTGHASVEHAVASMKAGAIDYLSKPIRADQFLLAVKQTLEFLRIRHDNKRLREEVARTRQTRIVGNGPAIRKLLDEVKLVAPSQATVLIQGESGTGKELVARAIHDSSGRTNGPFITINCAAMPDSLVESTLFGHEKGAFTGAIKQVKGAFERAHRGTLLLDEIGEMRLDLQSKLLRILQEQEFERVGGSSPVRVAVRVIATTNRDLATEVREGRFREDLFYRLSVVPVRTPTLRERPEDLELLVDYFVEIAARQAGKDVRGVSDDAMRKLAAHLWPGNVRELAHAVERAVILCPGSVIGPELFELLPDPRSHTAANSIRPARPAPNGFAPEIAVPSLNIAEAEQTLIEQALIAANQNRTRAADLLGISVRTLRNKLNRPEDAEAN